MLNPLECLRWILELGLPRATSVFACTAMSALMVRLWPRSVDDLGNYSVFFLFSFLLRGFIFLTFLFLLLRIKYLSWCCDLPFFILHAGSSDRILCPNWR